MNDAADPRGAGDPAGRATPREPTRRERVSAFYELTKPGITRLVVFTTAVGYYVAARGEFSVTAFLHALFGVALAASGTNALNQYVERDVDARMGRTRGRPLPSGRLTPRAAGRFALLLSAAGVLHLAAFVNLLTAAIVAACVVSYVLVYTPLKPHTTLATLVGAVPGALPIVAGWTAAGRGLDPAAMTLFWILFLWQIPHFLALAWIYRDDYRAGGLAMLSVFDTEGRHTARQTLLYTAALVPVSLLPTLLGLAGAVYFAAALTIGAAFLAAAAAMARQRTLRAARRLFVASVAYLPLLLFVLAIDRPAA